MEPAFRPVPEASPLPPYVWARVRPENDRSQRLFDRHGFLAFTAPGEQTLRVPPAGLAPGQPVGPASPSSPPLRIFLGLP